MICSAKKKKCIYNLKNPLKADFFYILSKSIPQIPVGENMGKIKNVFLLVAWNIFACLYIYASSDVFASDSLALAGKQILNGENDSIRIEANKYFQKSIKAILVNDPDMLFSFDSIHNVSVLISPDKKLRILSWVLPEMKNKTYTYFGYLQTAKSKKVEGALYELLDQTSNIENAEDAKLTTEKWFGGIYYKILENESFGKKYYTLLGWKGNNALSTKKVVDALYFMGKKPIFASSIFKVEKKIKNRLILEYNSMAVVSLKYDDKLKMIVFDHLSPADVNQTGMYENYGPDFSYDGLKFKRGKWELMKDIDLRNKDERHNKFKKPQQGLMPK